MYLRVDSWLLPRNTISDLLFTKHTTSAHPQEAAANRNFPAHQCNVDGSIDSEGSERGILAEPAAHLSADEDRGATQVQQPHRDEGGASRYVRIDDSAEGHPPTRHRRAQDRAYRDLCPRVVAADHLRADGRLRHERVQLGMRTKV